MVDELKHNDAALNNAEVHHQKISRHYNNRSGVFMAVPGFSIAKTPASPRRRVRRHGGEAALPGCLLVVAAAAVACTRPSPRQPMWRWTN